LLNKETLKRQVEIYSNQWLGEIFGENFVQDPSYVQGTSHNRPDKAAECRIPSAD